MKKKFCFLPWFFTFLCFLAVGTAAANDDLHDLAGHAWRADAFSGKWVILNYWAPWCHVCANEVSELNSFYRHNQDPKVLLLGIDYDHPIGSQLQQAVAKMNIQFPVMLEDPAFLWHIILPDSIPVTYIINPKGSIAKIIYGPSTERSLLDNLRQLQQ